VEVVAEPTAGPPPLPEDADEERPREKSSSPPNDAQVARLRFARHLLLVAPALYAGSALFGFFGMLGGSSALLVLGALIGLAHWVAAGIALVIFVLAPPSQQFRTLALVTLGVSALHFLLAVIGVFLYLPTVWNWTSLCSNLPVLFYLGNAGYVVYSGVVVTLTAVLELARLVLWAFTLRELVLTMKSRKIAIEAIILAAAAGGMTLLLVLLNVVLNAIAQGAMRRMVMDRDFSSAPSTIQGVGTAGLVLNHLGLLALLGFNVYVGFRVWEKAARRYGSPDQQASLAGKAAKKSAKRKRNVEDE
jgi:hypothetical protein